MKEKKITKPVKEKPQTTSTVETPQVKPEPAKEFNWHGFLKNMESVSLAMAQNLKRALFINEKDFGKSDTVLKLSYTRGDEVLYDYITEKSTSDKLLQALRSFTGKSDVDVKFSFIEEDKKIEMKVSSIEEKEEQEKKNLAQQKEKNILENQYIQEAQKLFDTKVDKIIIKD